MNECVNEQITNVSRLGIPVCLAPPHSRVHGQAFSCGFLPSVSVWGVWSGLSPAPFIGAEMAAAVPDITSVHPTVQKERASHLSSTHNAWPGASAGFHLPGPKLPGTHLWENTSP